MRVLGYLMSTSYYRAKDFIPVNDSILT